MLREGNKSFRAGCQPEDFVIPVLLGRGKKSKFLIRVAVEEEKV